MASKSSSPILDVQNIQLKFKTQYYHDISVRDYFVRFSKNPLAILNPAQSRIILDDVSFSLNPGDIVGVLGVNGSGKTSLCRCIAGYYRPNQGSIRVKGRTLALFDISLGIFPELTGRENAKILVHFLFPDLQDRHEEILEDALTFSELNEFLDVPYRTYSNGMQSRLCLSLISSAPSDLLILDEVFEGADQFFREKVSERIENLMRKSGATLFVSHHEGQVRRVCNRVLVINKSELVFDGSVDEGFALYHSLSQK